ncbi:MAG: hypothetical protein ABIP51_03385 [Bacteroidia bacterium]
MNYTNLNIDKISEAIELLSLRIKDRFPEAGLLKVCSELKTLSEVSKENIARVNKPYIFFRIAFYLLVVLALSALIYTFSHITSDPQLSSLANLITVSEALVSELAMIGASFYFLYKLEDLVKQKSVLNSLHELRIIAHVIDMHQLTKDPTSILSEQTKHSPKRELTKNDLSRYLDYCAEMLSLTSKVAANYANNNKDEVILNTINDIEILTSTLSGKIWQKIELNKLLN